MFNKHSRKLSEEFFTDGLFLLILTVENAVSEQSVIRLPTGSNTDIIKIV